MGANAQRRRLSAVPEQPDAPAATIQMQSFPLRLPTGRPAAIVVPTDITDLEVLGLINAALDVGDHLRAKRPTSRLVVP